MYKLKDKYDKADDFTDLTKWKCYLGRTCSDPSSPSCLDASVANKDWWLDSKFSDVNNFEQFFKSNGIWMTDPTDGFVDYKAGCSDRRNFIVDENGSVVFKTKSIRGSGGAGDLSNHVAAMRIESVSTYSNGAVFVIDVPQIPSNCAVWPAFWLVGSDDSWTSQESMGYISNWPNYGEIDILEQVNGENVNNVTLHTKKGCNISGTPKAVNDDCNTDDGKTGCSIVMNDGTGGKVADGVYACEWVPGKQIKTWFFPRASIPSSLKDDSTSVDTSSFGTPSAVHDLSSACSDTSYFQNMHMIINTTFCGQWASKRDPIGTCSVYGSGELWPIDSSNVYQTYSNCNNWLNNKILKPAGDNNFLDESYFWKINSVKVFTKDGGGGTPPSGRRNWLVIIAAIVLVIGLIFYFFVLRRKPARPQQTGFAPPT
jgi:hypothetical protein